MFMDYTDIYNAIKMNIIASGITLDNLESDETLYYDESGNVKHLVVNGGSLNADSDTVFVLGGVQADETISLSDLKARLGKIPTTEIKANKDLKGDFVAILKKDNLRQVLELIQEKGWHIHFDAVHVLYYGFVDIIDSIDGTEVNPFEFKAELYLVLRRDVAKTIEHFKKYKYPNIKNTQKVEFLDGIISMIDDQIQELASRQIVKPMLMLLKTLFVKAKSQKNLPFIQEEETHVWVKPFVQFYRQEIIQFAKKQLVFDEEKQVQSILGEEEIVIDDQTVSNYCFKDSADDAMIQVSDYVVSIVRKYIMFLDRTQPEVEADIAEFDETQMSNFKLINSILKESLDYNPMFFNFTICLHTYKKFMKYMAEYGE